MIMSYDDFTDEVQKLGESFVFLSFVDENFVAERQNVGVKTRL